METLTVKNHALDDYSANKSFPMTGMFLLGTLRTGWWECRSSRSVLTPAECRNSTCSVWCGLQSPNRSVGKQPVVSRG